MKERVYWIDYLRSFIILTVVIHHASLAYTTYAHFNKEAYILSTHPMVDVQRWIGFDAIVYFNDIFFMSLMFLISGFFVMSSIKRKGTRLFINDRIRRLFVPFIFGVTLIALLAYYPSYIYSHEDQNIFKYIADFLTIEFWPPGPAWFLWVLFVFNLIIVWTFPRLNVFLDRLGESLSALINRPFLLIAVWFQATWILYVPMRLLFGPDGWASLGPFDFQISRLFLYLGYFTLGTIVGTIPFEKGLLSDQSTFMRKWKLFIFLSLSTFCLLLLIDSPLKRLVHAGSISGFYSDLIYCSIFVASCVFSCAAYLTTSKAVFRRKMAVWDFITTNSFTLYLIHYVFIIWVQYVLLDYAFPALLKFLIVTLCSVALSLLISHFLHKSRITSRYL
ncbi:MAG: acyltransferase [Bacteroidales bacterium]|jgi:peptidoglycan/LPS O-acetylase OafA/YrhL|nr:acyltransferase [Bacteroidales bacterium]